MQVRERNIGHREDQGRIRGSTRNRKFQMATGSECPTFHIEVSPQRRAQYREYQRAINYCQEKLPNQTIADAQGLTIYVLPTYDKLGRVAKDRTECSFDLEMVNKNKLDTTIFTSF